MTVFIPGKLRNPLNGSWGGWRKHARLAKDWRERTAMRIFLESRTACRGPICRETPKTITFTAHVGAGWDDDNLPAAIKPIRDALVGTVIHSDAPNSGHTFVYRQVIDRKHRGVEIASVPSPTVGGHPISWATARRISEDGP